jgi:hypothetical protein
MNARHPIKLRMSVGTAGLLAGIGVGGAKMAE